jgi:hypothetical protein
LPLVKKLTSYCLACCLLLAPPAGALSDVDADNPFVEAMLRMMEAFGLIDRGYLSTWAGPHLPGTGNLAGMATPSTGFGMSPLSAWSGTQVPGMSPLGGWTGMPGMSPLGGWTGMPGAATPGMTPFLGGMPSTAWPGGAWNPATGLGASGLPGSGVAGTQQVQDLDGVWELSNGSVVIIKRNAARLFLSTDKFQDFVIGYDTRHFWWSPRGSNTTTRYRYQMRDGRMVLTDNEGKKLLMPRRI